MDGPILSDVQRAGVEPVRLGRYACSAQTGDDARSFAEAARLGKLRHDAFPLLHGTRCACAATMHRVNPGERWTVRRQARRRELLPDLGAADSGTET